MKITLTHTPNQTMITAEGVDREMVVEVGMAGLTFRCWDFGADGSTGATLSWPDVPKFMELLNHAVETRSPRPRGD